MIAAAAAKLLQSCPTLCDPIDGSPPGSPVPGILQARTLEWVAISCSNACECYPYLIFPSRVCERSYLIVLLICSSLTSFTLYLDFLLDELTIHILCLFSNWDVFLYQFVEMFNREGNGTPLQCSCLENPMDGGAWWAAVHGVDKSRTRLSDFTFTFHFHAGVTGLEVS